MNTTRQALKVLVLAAAIFGLTAGAAIADPCQVSAPGGTVTLPPAGCDYLSATQVHAIIDGLPPGTTIILKPIHNEFSLNSNQTNPDGSAIEDFGSAVTLQMSGTGALAGFNRTITLSADCRTWTGPRNPGDAHQSFPTEMLSLEGNLFGDPDFEYLSIVGGADNGFPSPGHTEITIDAASQGTAVVDSYFEIGYQIEFIGAPGGRLDGFGGSTQGTVNMTTFQ